MWKTHDSLHIQIHSCQLPKARENIIAWLQKTLFEQSQMLCYRNYKPGALAPDVDKPFDFTVYLQQALPALKLTPSAGRAWNGMQFFQMLCCSHLILPYHLHSLLSI